MVVAGVSSALGLGCNKGGAWDRKPKGHHSCSSAFVQVGAFLNAVSSVPPLPNPISGLAINSSFLFPPFLPQRIYWQINLENMPYHIQSVLQFSICIFWFILSAQLSLMGPESSCSNEIL